MNSLLAVSALLFLQILGAETSYTIQPGDSLTRIAARFGVTLARLTEHNDLKVTALLKVGSSLNVDTRHIVPPVEGYRIVVNIPQRMLFWVLPDGTIRSFPVAAGSRLWKTPVGEFTVVSREVDPTWDVPLSIQAEMRREGKPVPTRVPPSPQNPLGKYWIGLSMPNVGIHGTNAPSSIYSLVTHGCIRLGPENIEELFPRVEIGMPGRIIYDPVLVTQHNGSVFVEAHPDTYRRSVDGLALIVSTARQRGYLDQLDLNLAREVIRKREGTPRNVTKR